MRINTKQHQPANTPQPAATTRRCLLYTHAYAKQRRPKLQLQNFGGDCQIK